MGSESSTSTECDTIVVDSGNAFPISTSNTTSISSQSEPSDSEDVPTVADFTVFHPFRSNTSNTSVYGKSTPAPDHPQNEHPRNSNSSASLDFLHSSVSTWIGRLSGNDDIDVEGQVESYSDTETSESTSSDENTIEAEIWQPQASSYGIASKSQNQLLASDSLQEKSFARQCCFQKLECVSIPPLLVPKSRYENWTHTLPVSGEVSGLNKILRRISETSTTSVSYYDILLDDFVIYRPGTRTYYPWQMLTLDNIVSNREACKYRMNGTLKCGEIVQYVEGVELNIDAISIDGFEDIDIHSVQDMVYLQTVISAKMRLGKECWYRLGKPAEEYRDLYHRFLWVANLAKYVIDYLNWRSGSGDGKSLVHLDDFRHDFLAKLREWHDGDTQFQQWIQSYNRLDFRSPVNRHREFLFGRAFNLGRHYLKHDLWSEIMVRPVMSIAGRNGSPEDTIVTPYIRRCCRSMPWSYALRSGMMSEVVQNQHDCRATAIGFRTVHRRLSDMAENIPKAAAMLEKEAKSRTNVAITAEEALGSFAIVRMRKRLKGGRIVHDYSYVYIQEVVRKSYRAEMKVIFIYLPSETICLDAYYPYGNELFLSDCCNCPANSDPILLTDVIRVVGVTIGDRAFGSDDFFIRQKYVEAEDAICRLKESDFRCPCTRPAGSIIAKKMLEKEAKESLSGMGLFAGCGNLDFGLEQAGAIKFVAAIEIDETALKTYAANRPQGHDGLVLDSVNPCLSRIFKGTVDLPGIGIIQFISAGSPCKGFSRINCRREDDKGMRNCSLVASTLSYIETYLPNYAVLENVDAMGSGVGNSCNQGIACLVGLGYQVRKMQLNSRSFGSAQNRPRLFIVAAAPNVTLPSKPELSHGEDISFAKAAVVNEGLPPVDNDDLICISHPDHIPGVRQTPMRRELIRRVPRYPKGMNFLKSIEKGYQGEAQLEWYESKIGFQKYANHIAFTRLDPDSYIPTITTIPTPTCAFGGGRIIHWDQHRTLTLLEARRAQGFPDDEVIIGDIRQQWAQVGNAVNRKVATALGKTIADSWFSSPPGRPEIIVDISQKFFRRNNQTKIVISVEDVNGSAVNSPRKPKLLSDQINDETEALIEEGHHLMKTATTESEYFDITGGGSNANSPSTVVDNQPKETPASAAKANNLITRRISDDESEFINNMIHLNETTSNLRFNQIQQRQISTVERKTTGASQPVLFLAERSIEVRTKSPSSSATAVEYGSAEHPIEIDTEVSISKRRREESLEEEEEEDDDEPRSWVGKRVKSRINEWTTP